MPCKISYIRNLGDHFFKLLIVAELIRRNSKQRGYIEIKKYIENQDSPNIPSLPVLNGLTLTSKGLQLLRYLIEQRPKEFGWKSC